MGSCVKPPSDNAALVRTADAQAGVPESDSGSAEGIWSVFQYVNVPSPYTL